MIENGEFGAMGRDGETERSRLCFQHGIGGAEQPQRIRFEREHLQPCTLDGLPIAKGDALLDRHQQNGGQTIVASGCCIQAEIVECART